LLVLNRSKNEAIEIECPDGSKILIVHMGIRGHAARYGIEAPLEYKINRIERPDHISEAKPRPRGKRIKSEDGRIVIRREK
jgi:carbon storage regulator CsrA